MTDRIPLDHLTSDDLDKLYEQLDRAQRVAMRALDQDEPGTAGTTPPEPAPAGHRDQIAEATVQRVIDLCERWAKAGPPPLGTSMARWWDTRLAELHTALSPTGEPPRV